MEPMGNNFGSGYFGNIKLGEEKIEVKALFDTGSSIIWFADSSCKDCID